MIWLAPSCSPGADKTPKTAPHHRSTESPCPDADAPGIPTKSFLHWAPPLPFVLEPSTPKL
jgi:hypothetical protein